MTLIENATLACEAFNRNMKALFPNFTAEAKLHNTLGPHVSVVFADVASEKEAPHGIIRNAKCYMLFMMHLSDNFGNPLADDSKVSIEQLTSNSRSVKYRKISGKTPEDAMQKLLKWFQKNADTINSL